ncbi:MAG: DNA-binding NtrC family response regulator [Verrucomicrobiales bacterium]|jgi:DNA-binding NtrC family response regulator
MHMKPDTASAHVAATHILIVDDDEGLRESLSDAFELMEFTVSSAGSAEQAHILLKSAKPDVVLMDYTLPGQCGISAMIEIHRTYPELSIIGLSAEDDQETAFIDAGASGFLAKPFTIGELLEVMRRCKHLSFNFEAV